MCCSGMEFLESEINGECSSCGERTVDGQAYESCTYSPSECSHCDYRPCDQSC